MVEDDVDRCPMIIFTRFGLDKSSAGISFQSGKFKKLFEPSNAMSSRFG